MNIFGALNEVFYNDILFVYMDLRLYNTLTRKKEIFRPLKNKQVGIYTCGPTVYWYQHIGNLRSYIFPDILKRVLSLNGFKIKHVMNITDVGQLTSNADEGEDKIEKAAAEEGKKAKDIADYYWQIFRDDFKKLNIIEPDIWTKATEHIKEQIELIKKLEEKGYTYKTDDGIYFDTGKFKDYAKLAKLQIEGLEAGNRTEMRDKKNKTDFALWKFSDKPGKRQQEWQSPWGLGFPGWHIECSAMSMKYLGDSFDIHTGGIDHIPIHHTNEIAQSEAATGKKFVNFWMHGAFLVFKGKKISKSKGGLYTIAELEEKGFSPLAFRYFTLMAHYRASLDFSLENLGAAQNALENLKQTILELKNDNETGADPAMTRQMEEKFLEAVNDDLNMPKALAILWEVARHKKLPYFQKRELILKFDEIFGLGLKEIKASSVPTEIISLVEQRKILRKEKKWQEADEIRQKLEKIGWMIKDNNTGTEITKIKQDNP